METIDLGSGAGAAVAFAAPQVAARRVKRLTVGFLTLCAVAGVAWVFVPGEICRWHVARAEVARTKGDEEAAELRLREALAWEPNGPEPLLRRAQWRKEAGRFQEALEDFDRVLLQRPGDPQAVFGRTSTLQRLGRHEEAIGELESLVSASGGTAREGDADRWALPILVQRFLKLRGQAGDAQRRSSYLNALAYARAVAGRQLTQALEEADSAIRLQRESALGMSETPAELLDTRGFLLAQLDRLEPAAEDLNRAVRQIDVRLVMIESDRSYVDAFERRQWLAETREAAAVIHYHRALVLDRLGKSDAAEADRRKVRQLGYEPGESLF